LISNNLRAMVIYVNTDMIGYYMFMEVHGAKSVERLALYSMFAWACLLVHGGCAEKPNTV